jgi:peptide deformylase
MILPIYLYGQSVLKKRASPIDSTYRELQKLIDDMYETMYHAQGVGLAAPQIGLPIRLFVVDTQQTYNEDKDKSLGIKKVFINAEIIDEWGDTFPYEEGCLSIPMVRGDVEREENIKIRYWDEKFNEYIEDYSGLEARVIQHEYDHIEGVLFTELLKPVRKRLVRKKLDKIRTGILVPEYRYYPNK